MLATHAHEGALTQSTHMVRVGLDVGWVCGYCFELLVVVVPYVYVSVALCAHYSNALMVLPTLALAPASLFASGLAVTAVRVESKALEASEFLW